MMVIFMMIIMITGRGLKAAGRYKRFRDLYCVIEVECTDNDDINDNDDNADENDDAHDDGYHFGDFVHDSYK